MLYTCINISKKYLEDKKIIYSWIGINVLLLVVFRVTSHVIAIRTWEWKFYVGTRSIHSELTRAGSHYQSWALKGHTRNGVTRAWWAKTRLGRPPDRDQCQEASQAAVLKAGDDGRTWHPETLLCLHYLNQQEALEGKEIWGFLILGSQPLGHKTSLQGRSEQKAQQMGLLKWL